VNGRVLTFLYFSFLAIHLTFPIRFLFIGYLVALQVFLLYVRIKAKQTNDRTPVILTNPLTNMLQSQLDNQENAMMKNLASSFLSSESTVVEYDLKQAKSMQGGLLFNMCLMWFLHFKMEQIQPVIISSLSGIFNMYYSPLFQVYILGRNLERPFKNPAMKKYEEASVAMEAHVSSEAAETTTTDDAGESAASAEEDEEAEAEEDSEQGVSDESEDDSETEDEDEQ
jgi:hypothetical protein